MQTRNTLLVFPLLFILLAACSTPVRVDGPIIADVHMHPRPENAPQDVLTWMDRNRVHWAGLGSIKGGRALRERYAQVMGNRYIPFGGQHQLNVIFFKGGVSALEDPDNVSFKALMGMLEADFAAGKLKGIGEIFANNSASSSIPKLRRKMRVDAPTNRAMLDLVAKYSGFLNIHAQWDDDTVKQLERLADYNRNGRIVIAHCGSNSSAHQIRMVLDRHPNLFCDLSARHPPKQRKPQRRIFSATELANDWKVLIEDMPDRFMVGTDVKTEAHYDESIWVIRGGLLSNLSPETANKVAYKNAQRLFGLTR